MKIAATAFLFGLMRFLVAENARAELAAESCTQWEFKTNSDQVTAKSAKAMAQKILDAGKDFSFELDENQRGDANDFFFRFNHQQLRFDNQELEDRYLSFVANLMKKYPAQNERASFTCSFASGGPRPRISGSN